MSRVTSEGFGLATTFERSSVTALARADLLASMRLTGAFRLRAAGGLVVPMARSPFVMLDAEGREEVLHRPAPVALRFALGLEARFP